jgi:hypothetical protein
MTDWRFLLLIAALVVVLLADLTALFIDLYLTAQLP